MINSFFEQTKLYILTDAIRGPLYILNPGRADERAIRGQAPRPVVPADQNNINKISLRLLNLPCRRADERAIRGQVPRPRGWPRGRGRDGRPARGARAVGCARAR